MASNTTFLVVQEALAADPEADPADAVLAHALARFAGSLKAARLEAILTLTSYYELQRDFYDFVLRKIELDRFLRRTLTRSVKNLAKRLAELDQTPVTGPQPITKFGLMEKEVYFRYCAGMTVRELLEYQPSILLPVLR